MKIVKANEVSRRSIDLLEATKVVIPIIQEVRDQGDAALRKYAQQFDRQQLEQIVVSKARIEEAKRNIDSKLLQALNTAKTNIAAYHKAQLPKDWMMSIAPGITAGQLIRPISKVGCYVPGGRYPLVSTILMTTIVARIAGVEQVIVCTPRAVPEILVACDLAGVDLICEVGGAQAIAAMAYGTESVPKVDKIVGPGNRYVTAAKKAVYGDVGIDFLAGPSEVLVIADDSSNPTYIAADLIAQAEHDDDAMAILVTPSRALAEKVLEALEVQLASLPTAQTARRSLEQNGMIVLTDTLDEAFDVSNRLAPEHLEILLENVDVLDKIKSAASVFLGMYSAEALGDYATGPNHVLPTGGVAAWQSGLNIYDFIKQITVQQVTPEGILSVGGTVSTLARLEGLEGHARAVQVRMQSC